METFGFWACVVVILAVLALPPALKARSWLRFFISMVLSAVGILIPLFIFFASMFLTPEWKGGCDRGWLDCFHLGKLALTPLVLWATAAFYLVQIMRTPHRSRTWIVMGIFTGAIVSSVCFVIGLVIHAVQYDIRWFLLIPFYVAVWYTILCVRLIKASGLSPAAYIVTFCSSLPLWVISLYWSRSHYLSLPDKHPGCFVVMAALRGTPSFVGRYEEVDRSGGKMVVNRQLLIFWRFEEIWCKYLPRMHTLFRRYYNRLGPIIASRMQTRIAANSVYILLKPFEWFAVIVVRLHEGN